MYIITIILELTPDTDHMEMIDYYESKIAQPSANLPGVEKISCVKLRSAPFDEKDKTPLRNLFFQIQVFFETEEAVQTTLENEQTTKIIDKVMSFSNCNFHWFAGHESTFYPDRVIHNS